jgi:hypothetical protein
MYSAHQRNVALLVSLLRHPALTRHLQTSFLHKTKLALNTYNAVIITPHLSLSFNSYTRAHHDPMRGTQAMHKLIPIYRRKAPKEGQMRFAGQASRSNKPAICWAANARNNALLDLEGYLTKLALRATLPSFGNTTVYRNNVSLSRGLRGQRHRNISSMCLGD